ncbi:MAG: PRC-barrel domain-containing protein [Patescibacteria group bacterium]
MPNTTVNLLVRRLPVFTNSGFYVGRLQSINLDELGGSILFYQVQRGCWRFKKVFLIKPKQIIKITHKKIVVEDATIKTKLNQGVETVVSTAMG